VLEGKTVHIPDVLEDREFIWIGTQEQATARPDRSESGFPKDSEGASLTH